MTVDLNQTSSVAEAFGRKSVVYDAFGKDHENLTRMRERVYGAITRQLKPGSHLLEINAGTGFDAVQMVTRGYSVHATDLSAGMVDSIKEKIVKHEIGSRLTAEELSFTELNQVQNGPFDGVYSNFGGLNCVPDLSEVTRHLPSILRPGGLAIWVIMPRICPWELGLMFKDWRVATRRFRPDGVMANVEGVQFKTWYFSPGQAIRAFGPQFECVGLEGLSVVTPSADNKTFALNRPKLFRRLVTLDENISTTWPFNRMGDFFILTMKLKEAKRS
ncbi:MAG: class I SAM-dependent methyltransferase [Chloroflexota bacterium]